MVTKDALGEHLRVIEHGLSKHLLLFLFRRTVAHFIHQRHVWRIEVKLEPVYYLVKHVISDNIV